MDNFFVARKRKTRLPCEVCGLHLDRCICELIPRLDLSTRVTLIIHAKELKRTTNTGRLAVQALANSRMLVRGVKGEREDVSRLLDPAYESYLLYPSDDAIDLALIRPVKPVQLIVGDGNWRQASKVNTRYPEFVGLPRVKISAVNKGVSHLRREHFAEGFSTLEAIARAMSVLEGADVGEQLLSVYQAKLRATLAGRGARDV